MNVYGNIRLTKMKFQNLKIIKVLLMKKTLLFVVAVLSISNFLLAQTIRYRDEIFSSYTLQSNIQYGIDASKNLLDLYTATGDTVTNRPLIIFLHGGAFKDGDKDPNTGKGGAGFVRYMGYKMPLRGYVVASINYRLTSGWVTDQAHVEAMLKALQDARAAVRFFRKNAALYGIDTSLIFISGQSAGSHTALAYAYLDSTEVPSYVNWANVGGTFDGARGNPGYSTSVKGCMEYWGAVIDTNNIIPGNLPVFCVHGTNDLTVPYDYGLQDSPMNYGSLSIYNRAQHLGIYSGIRLFPGMGHSLDSNADSLNAAYLATAPWLYNLLLSLQSGTSPINVGSVSSFGNQVTGTNSSDKSYSVSATGLTGDLTITPPSNFQISLTSGSGYVSYPSSLTLHPVGGYINPATIYVRFSPSNDNGLNFGNITHTSPGVSSQNVVVSGNALSVLPSTQSSISFGTVTTSSIVVNFTGGNGGRRILVAHLGSSATFIPASGNPVTGVNSDFTLASDQGNNDKIIYDGIGSTVTVTGLVGAYTYYFTSYEYNVGSGTSQNYLTSSPGSGSQITATPAIQQSDITPFPENFDHSGSLPGWTLGSWTLDNTANPSNIAANTPPSLGLPASSGSYNALYTSTGSKTITFNGTNTKAYTDLKIIWGARNQSGATFTVTFEYSIDGTTWISPVTSANAQGGNASYQWVNSNTWISLPVTAQCPSLRLRWTVSGTNTNKYRMDDVYLKGILLKDVTNVNFSWNSSTTADVSWSNPDNYNSTSNKIIAFMKAGNPISIGSPSSSISSYNASTVFGNGSKYQNDTSAFCIYKGDGNLATVSNLVEGTVYYVTVFNSNTASNYTAGVSYLPVEFNPVTAIIEGLYNGTAMTPDTVTIELHDSLNYSLISSAKGLLDANGQGSFKFSGGVRGIGYYLAVKHRNAIETWSAAPVSGPSYDFSSAESSAFGNNLIFKGSKWCIYSGDITQDGIVDSGDMGVIDNDNANYISGYTNTDVNGDGIVDSGDLGIVDNNNAAYVGKIIPSTVLRAISGMYNQEKFSKKQKIIKQIILK
jgi:acetyl esterase/lipase